jgi:hypothetical protein
MYSTGSSSQLIRKLAKECKRSFARSRGFVEEGVPGVIDWNDEADEPDTDNGGVEIGRAGRSVKGGCNGLVAVGVLGEAIAETVRHPVCCRLLAILRSNGGGRLAGDVVRSGGRGWKVL